MGENAGGQQGTRGRIGLLLAPIVFVVLWVAPFDLPVPAHRLAAILGAVIVLWVSEAIPMAATAFLGVAFAVLLGVAPAAKAFAPFADPLIFLFIGTFMLAQAIFFHGLDRRFALTILALPGIDERPGRLLAAYAAVSCVMSMWISNTATTAMMFPIGVSLLSALERPGAEARVKPAYAAALLLSNAFAASIGGLATPVGTPPNLIGVGFIRRETGAEIPFFSWMMLGLPVTIVLYTAMVADLWRSAAGSTLSGARARILAERRALGGWTRGQVNSLVAFGLTVFFWILPGIVALVAGESSPLYVLLKTALPEGVVALLGASLLFLLPVDWKAYRFTLPWSEAIKIDWWIVFLYGGGIALGTLAFESGLAEALGRGLTHLVGVRSGFGLLVLSCLLAVVLSETTSNTASANMVVPVVIAVARSADLDPVLPALGATMSASLGFLLPVSTPTNAIVYGSGRIPLTTMMRHGIVLDLVGVVVIIATVALLGPWVLGRPLG